MSNIGLYIHIPFCKQKCPYCDFFSVSTSQSDFDDYTDILIFKTELYSERFSEKTVDTIYFGGGTPSLIGDKNLVKILNAVYKNFRTSNPEVTVEVNPTSQSLIDFSNLYSAGFNRLSVGLQSANEKEQLILGRKHNTIDVINTLSLAKKSGFTNISLDLMLGVPYQTEESLKNSIEFCADSGVSHISAYILKIEENTPFYKKRNEIPFCDDDYQAYLYELCCDELIKNGYNQYEISNFCKQGFESRHNLKYWNCDEYLGLGPSAHSFINGERFYYSRSFDDFKNDVIHNDGIGGTQEEYIMLRLRLSDGINFDEYKKRFNKTISDSILNKAKKYEKAGFLTITDKNIALTRKGFLLSNSIISDLLF